MQAATCFRGKRGDAGRDARSRIALLPILGSRPEQISRAIPVAVKVTIGALAVIVVNEVFRALVDFPVLAANLTASSVVTLESVAVLACLAALILVLKRKALGRWMSIAALGLAYLHHVTTWLSNVHPGSEEAMAQQTGAAMFEAVLLFACISLLANLFFSGSVRAYFDGTAATPDVS